MLKILVDPRLFIKFVSYSSIKFINKPLYMESDFTCNPGPTQILFRLKNLTWPEHAAVPAVADQQLAAPHHRRLTLPKSGSIFVAAFSTDFSSDASCDA